MAAAPTCPRCNRDLPEGARFCLDCGARLAGPPRELRRNRAAAKLAGVCAGLGDYLVLDHTLVRAVYLVATFFTGIAPGLLLYLILAVVIPPE